MGAKRQEVKLDMAWDGGRTRVVTVLRAGLGSQKDFESNKATSSSIYNVLIKQCLSQPDLSSSPGSVLIEQNTSDTKCGPPPTTCSLTPPGCPVIELNSDSTCLRFVQTPRVEGSVPQDLFPPSDTHCKG